MPSLDMLETQAVAYLKGGDHLRAIACYERLLSQAPHRADAWFNLGYARHRVGRYHEALSAYERALEAGATAPHEIQLQRAVLLANHLARPEHAREALHAAVSLAPSFVQAWVNLGNLEERLGQRADAWSAYQSALSLEPEHPLALARVCRLAELSGPGDALIGRLQQVLGRAALDAAGRADIAFALAEAMDRLQEFDQAFELLEMAHATIAEDARQRGQRYDPQGTERWFSRQAEAFPLASCAPDDDRPAPIFICGMFRSGSTLLEKMLGAHPAVTAAGEVELLPRIARTLSPDGPRWPPTPGDLAGWRHSYLAELHRRHGTWRHLTDKNPGNIAHVGLIKAMFPKARILHTRRHPLDNCLAVHFLHMSVPHAQTLQDTVHWYIQYRRLMAHWRRHFDEDILDVDYEGLVQQPREVLGQVLDFCRLPWAEECLAFHSAPGVVATPSAWQVRQPLYAHAIGRWKNYAAHLETARRALSEPGLIPG